MKPIVTDKRQVTEDRRFRFWLEFKLPCRFQGQFQGKSQPRTPNRLSTRFSKRLSHTLSLIAVVPVLLLGCQSETDRGIAELKSQPTPLAALPQDGSIQVYFNQNAATTYQEPDRDLTRPGDNLEQIMLTAIAQAKTEIKIAVQEFRLPRLAQALADRAKSGVQVQVMLENTYATAYSKFSAEQIQSLTPRERKRYEDNKALIDGNRDGLLSSEEIQTRDALVILDQAQIPRRDDTANGSQGSGLMHHKFMVIDGQTTIVTSANWTISDIHGDLTNASSRGNANSLVKINSPEVAKAFLQEFDTLYRDRKFKTKKPLRPVQRFTVGGSKLQLHFSPSKPRSSWNNSTNGLIAEVATQAKSSLDMALFVFSDPQLSNRLSVLPSQNVRVRGLFDPGFFARSYSNSLDMLGIPADSPCRRTSDRSDRRSAVRSSEAPDRIELSSKASQAGSRKSKKAPIAHPWPVPATFVAIPKLKPGDLLHHKFAVVDRTTVILGSHNWTSAGNYKNDETLMVIDNPTIAAQYQREFDRLAKDAIPGKSCESPTQSSTQPEAQS